MTNFVLSLFLILYRPVLGLILDQCFPFQDYQHHVSSFVLVDSKLFLYFNTDFLLPFIFGNNFCRRIASMRKTKTKK